jgi:hypothetical protein
MLSGLTNNNQSGIHSSNKIRDVYNSSQSRDFD